MKYEVERSVGCLSSGRLLINGRDEYDMNTVEREEFLSDLFQHIREEVSKGNTNLADLMDVIPSDQVEYSDTCEQCFDSVCTTKWEI
jgi:hypothetical protein